MIGLLTTYLRPYTRTIVLILGLLLVGAIGNLYLPNLQGDIINNGVVKGDTDYILRVGGLMLLVTGIVGIAERVAAGELGAERAVVRSHRPVFGALGLLAMGLRGVLRGELPGDVVRDARPGGHLEPVVADGPDRRGIRSQDALRVVHDHPEQLAPVVRRGQATGDPEDGVESLGQLRFETHRRRRRLAGVGLRDRHAIRPDDPPEDGAGSRGARSVGGRGGHRRPDGSRWIVPETRSCAHGPMVARRGRAKEPPSVPVTGVTIGCR
jgi:hypothetical protein